MATCGTGNQLLSLTTVPGFRPNVPGCPDGVPVTSNCRSGEKAAIAELDAGAGEDAGRRIGGRVARAEQQGDAGARHPFLAGAVAGHEVAVGGEHRSAGAKTATSAAAAVA